MSQTAQNKTQKLLDKAISDLQQGDLNAAERGFRQVVKKHPNISGVHYNLGYIYHSRGDSKKAESSYRRAVELDANNASGWLNLGNVQLQQDKHKLAEKSLRKALALGLEQAGLYNSLASSLDYQNKSEEAEILFKQAIDMQPAEPLTRLNLARLMHRQQRFKDSVPILQQFVADAPDNVDGWLTLGRALEETGDFEAAYTHYQTALQHFPDYSNLRDLLGGVCINLEKLDEAEVQFCKVLELDGKNFSAMNNLGLTLSALGKRDDAELSFRNALKVRPSMGDAYRNISALKKFKSEDDDVAAIRKLLKQKSLDDYERMHLSFALGKAMDDLENYEQAFENYRAGNDLKKQYSPFQIEAYSSHVDRIISVFDDAFFKRLRDSIEQQSDSNVSPVFIIGMPRSGTTLVEQVLASHSKVFGAGELMTIGGLIRSLENDDEINQSAPYPECVMGLSGERCMELGPRYIKEIKERFEIAGAERITDKMPFNFIHLGFIASILPSAKIIHCQRDPLDTCLSNYFQYFIKGSEFSYDLDSLGQYYLEYLRLMRHWRQVLPLPIHDIHYDDMVSETEETAKDLVKFTGLQWEPGCLYFYQSSRSVRTSSSWQVRQPVYKQSLKRWENYSEYLNPLRELIENQKPLQR